jgi:hypothetical protein
LSLTTPNLCHPLLNSAFSTECTIHESVLDNDSLFR